MRHADMPRFVEVRENVVRTFHTPQHPAIANQQVNQRFAFHALTIHIIHTNKKSVTQKNTPRQRGMVFS